MKAPLVSPAQLHETVRTLAGQQGVTVSVTGDCMQPLIQDKAQLQVAPARMYLPGDVVVILSPQGSYLVHRVIGAYRKAGICKVVTQADTVARPDTAVHFEAILGKVSGGACHHHAVQVPLSYRMNAGMRFLRFLAARLFGHR